MAITALVVDDHLGFRTSARVLLEMEGFDVVGEAVDGASAVTAAETLRPDVILLDVQLPDAMGFDVARELFSRGFAGQIVLVSSRDASDYGFQLNVTGFDWATLSGVARPVKRVWWWSDVSPHER